MREACPRSGAASAISGRPGSPAKFGTLRSSPTERTVLAGRRAGCIRVYRGTLILLPALRTRFRFASGVAPLLVVVDAWRRPDLVLRRTLYEGAIVDERHLTRAFPWVAPPSRAQLLGVFGGHVTFETAGGPLRAEPGDVVLLTPPMASRARFERTHFVDLEWTTTRAESIETPRVVGRTDAEGVRALASTIASSTLPFERAFDDARAVLAHAGASFDGLDVDRAWLGPTPRDERIATAIGAQLASLATKASASDLGELATLSPRQLQRVLEKFSATYGINGGNWRDMRNRWRLQLAAVLLAFPELSVADIAKDVGYATATALARAFSAVGYPPPLELRALLLGGT